MNDEGQLCPSCGRVRTERRCPICKTMRKLAAFAPQDGYCRDCRREYRRRYYLTVTVPGKRKRGAAA